MKNEIFNVIQGNSGVVWLIRGFNSEGALDSQSQEPWEAFKGNGGEGRDKLPVFSKTSSLLSLFRWIVLH